MEEVTLEFWVNQPMARSEGLWDTLMAEYEELNPGVTVASLIIPHGDYEPKVLTGLARRHGRRPAGRPSHAQRHYGPARRADAAR